MKLKNLFFIIIVLVIIAIVILNLIVFYPIEKQETIRIGYVAVLSGPVASQWGFHARDAADMAVEEINQKGDVKLEIVYGDSAAKPEQGVSEFKRLNDLYDIDIFLIDASAVASAIAPLGKDYKKPILFGSAAVSDITKSSDFLFRNFYICDNTAPELAINTYNKLKARKIVIISQNDPYGQSCSQIFRKTFTSLGGEILGEEKFSMGEVDFKTQLTKLSDFESDAIYVLGYPKQLLGIINQIKELGINKTIIGELTLYTIEIRSDIASITEISPVYFTVTDFYREYDITTDFKNRYKEKFGKESTHVAGYMYDSLYLIGKAAEISKSQKISLKQALTKSRIDGVNGLLYFDENRETVQNVYFVKLNNDSSLTVIS